MRYAVIIAGGTGTRLWPMSRASLPKQLIPFIGGRSLLSHAWERLEGVVEPSRRMVCAAEGLRGAIMRELPGMPGACFLGEPEGRDTLNALGYAAAVIARQDPEAVIAVLTADHVIEPAEVFRKVLAAGYGIAEASPETLVTFGIRPTRPATGFGYLKLGKPFREGSRIVEEFREKPDLETARRYLDSGEASYLWNGGMFVWRAGTFLDCLQRYEPEAHAAVMRIGQAWGTSQFDAAIGELYPRLRKVSVDFAVMEPASRDPRVRIAALPLRLSWLDIGSWPSYAETCAKDAAGNALAAGKTLLEDTTGCLIASQDPGHLVAALGCEDLIIVHTPDATLVCRKDRAEDIKRLQALAARRFGPPYV